MPVKRVAVIGAGVSGISAIKSCLDEGLEPTCFEGTNDIGGLWRYEAKVCSVRKRPDFSSTGQWDVVVDVDGKQEFYIFDGIMVCSGHYNYPYLPLKDFQVRIKKFKGHYFHTWEYKNPEKFLGKRIAVIGIGNSGADVACELSHGAKQVFLSTRRGAWIWSRLWDNGYPIDTVLFTRFYNYINKWLTTSMINNWAENKLNSKFNHTDFGLQPEHRFLSHQPTFSDDMPNHIISGRLQVKPNVIEFTETTAIFEDGTEEEIDVVIFATGYTFDFPFLEDNLKNIDNEHTMYKFVFPPFLDKPTLAFIGILQPVGATIPTSELQSRWVARVFKGAKKLPSQRDMMVDIKRTRDKLDKQFLKSPRDTSRVPYVQYMDEIASEIDVKPNPFCLFLQDPKLALEVLFGPCTPYQYRLQGPGKWAGARTAILTQRERIIKPMRTRTLKCHQPPCSVLCWLLGAGLSLSLFVFILAING